MPDRRDSLPFFYGFRSSLPPAIIRLDGRQVAFYVTMLALISVASGLYLRQASAVASYANQIRKLEEEREWVHREIVSLRAEMAEQDSLQRCLQAGQQLGYVLPDAADQTRRLRIEYQAPQQPAADAMAGTGEGTSSGDQEQAAEPETGNVFQQLIRQFEIWIAGPPKEGNP